MWVASLSGLPLAEELDAYQNASNWFEAVLHDYSKIGVSTGLPQEGTKVFVAVDYEVSRYKIPAKLY